MHSMISRVMWLLVVTVGLKASPSSAQDLPKPPEMAIPRCVTAPTIDGKLDDACWQKAALLPPFYLYQGQGKTSDAQTVKIVCDDQWLYFAFDIRVPNVGVTKPTTMDHDGSVADDDSVEVFIDPGTGGSQYLHYLLSKANVRAERRCNPKQGALREINWDFPWRSATVVASNSWQAELAIPLAILAQECKDSTLGKATMNVGVNRILATLNIVGVPIAATREIASWAPVKSSFHEPDRFGTANGLESLKPKPPLLVAAQSVKTGSYQAEEQGGFFYEVSGTVRSFTDIPGAIEVEVADKPSTGQGETVRQSLTLSKAEEKPFTIKVPVKVLAGRTAVLALRDPATGEALQSMPLNDLAALCLMRAFSRYSYYTSESQASVMCELGLPAQELKRLKLTAKDTAGKILAEVAMLQPQTLLPVPLASLKDGQHPVSVELQRQTGESVIRQEVILIKRAPKPGCEWKIDHADHVILNNGKPLFPFGIMTSGRTSLKEEIMIKDIADMGFNTVVRFGPDQFNTIEDLLRLAQKYNLHVVEWPGTWQVSKTEQQAGPTWGTAAWWDWQMTNLFLPGARKLMNHPNLITWYLFDEPQANRDYASWILTLHKKLYELDGYHPTEVLYVPPVPEGAEFDNCDIFGIDPYWAPGAGVGEVGNPNVVGKQTWILRRRADRDLKLAWITPCAEFYSGTRLRIYSESEQRVQTYLALIQGAKGILYFVYPFKHENTHDTFVRLGKEMTVLGPACAAADVPQTIRYAPTGFDPLNNVFPDIQVALKRNPAGGYILLAANWRPYPVDMTCKVSLLDKAKEVRQLFNKDKTLAVEQGTFTDPLSAMDTRAYAIDGPTELSAPMELSVETTAHPEKNDPFYTALGIPDSGAPGRKNMLRNSSFEECSIPGMPDYYWDIRTAGTMQGLRINDVRGDCSWKVDTNQAYEGRSSLAIRSIGGFLLFGVSPRIERETPFTFSAWVRGDPGSGICFYTGGQTYHPLSNQWQRISTTMPLPAETPYGGHLIGFWIRGANSNATVWIDAMQFEQGTNTTAYER